MLNSQLVSAQIGGVFPQFIWGGRHFGSSLKGVYVNDPFCIIYNPAYSGLADNRIGIEQKNIYGLKYTALSLVKNNYGTYLILNQSPADLNFNYNTYRFGSVYSFNWYNFNIGLKNELLFLAVTDISDQSDYMAKGYNFGLGIDYREKVKGKYFDEFFIGLMADNIYNQLHYSTGTSEDVGRSKYNLTLGMNNGGLTTGINFEQEEKGDLFYNIGVDYVYNSFNKEIIDEIMFGLGFHSNETFTAGFGLEFRGYRFNYGYNFKGKEIKQTISTSFSF